MSGKPYSNAMGSFIHVTDAVTNTEVIISTASILRIDPFPSTGKGLCARIEFAVKTPPVVALGFFAIKHILLGEPPEE